MIRQLVFILLLVVSSQAQASLTVVLNGKTATMEQGSLAQAVQAVQAVRAEDIYWPAAQLFYQATDNKRLKKLESLLAKAELPTSNKYDLLDYFTNETVKTRIKQSIFPAQVLLKEAFNPNISTKPYALYLTARPDTLTVFGAIEQKAQKLNYQNGTTIAQYAKQIAIAASASADYIYVIQPNGTVVKAGVSYWNNTNYVPMPGSQLFVPFTEPLVSISQHTKQLNKLLLTLAQDRIPQ